MSVSSDEDENLRTEEMTSKKNTFRSTHPGKSNQAIMSGFYKQMRNWGRETKRFAAVVLVDLAGTPHCYGHKVLRNAFRRSNFAEQIHQSRDWNNTEVLQCEVLDESMECALPHPAKTITAMNQDELKQLFSDALRVLDKGKQHSFGPVVPVYWPPYIDHKYPKSASNFVMARSSQFNGLSAIIREVIRYIYAHCKCYHLLGEGDIPVLRGPRDSEMTRPDDARQSFELRGGRCGTCNHLLQERQGRNSQADVGNGSQDCAEFPTSADRRDDGLDTEQTQQEPPYVFPHEEFIIFPQSQPDETDGAPFDLPPVLSSLSEDVLHGSSYDVSASRQTPQQMNLADNGNDARHPRVHAYGSAGTESQGDVPPLETEINADESSGSACEAGQHRVGSTPDIGNTATGGAAAGEGSFGEYEISPEGDIDMRRLRSTENGPGRKENTGNRKRKRRNDVSSSTGLMRQGMDLNAISSEILDGKDTPDDTVEAFFDIIRKAAPTIQGLITPALLEYECNRDQVVPFERKGLVVQVHLASSHWLVSCSRDGGSINIYDSLASQENNRIDYNPGLRRQLALLYREWKDCQDEIDVNYAILPRQHGSTDCGFFSFAYVTAFLFGKDPRKLIFEQGKLREHTLKILLERKLEMFPHKIRKMVPVINRTVSIHCCFRRIENAAFVQCTSCYRWLHVSCIGRRQTQREARRACLNPALEFFCDTCRT